MKEQVEELSRLARDNPGSEAAIDLAGELMPLWEHPEVSEALKRIIMAWGKRLYLATGAHRHERGSENHESRILEASAWVWEHMKKWRPNPEGDGRGAPSAYLNSIKGRLPSRLSVSTGTVIDGEPKARRAAAAIRKVQERAEAEGAGRLSLSEIRDRAEGHMSERLRRKNPDLDAAQIKERLRKDSMSAWLNDIELLLETRSVEVEEDSQELCARSDTKSLTSDLIEDMIEGDSPSQMRRRLCAPHLQYIVSIWRE